MFDEGIYRGYMYEINRPRLLNVKKVKNRRPVFDMAEVRALRANFDYWIERARTDSIEIRRLLKDYVIILLDTGMRPGVEIDELLWGQIEIKFYPEKSEAHLDPKNIDPMNRPGF